MVDSKFMHACMLNMQVCVEHEAKHPEEIQCRSLTGYLEEGGEYRPHDYLPHS